MTKPKVDVTVAIMTVPARADRLDELAAAIAPLGPPVIVSDDELSRDTWAQYQRCLTEGRRGTHRIVIQDDALLVDDFAARARKLIGDHPGRLICLYTPALPSIFSRPMIQAHADGRDVAELHLRSMFTPLVCTAWPVALADLCLSWGGHLRGPHGHRGRADDARVADWLKGSRPMRQALASVPCLADHDETAESQLANGGRYSRRAAILPDTPVGELTIA